MLQINAKIAGNCSYRAFNLESGSYKTFGLHSVINGHIDNGIENIEENLAFSVCVMV